MAAQKYESKSTWMKVMKVMQQKHSCCFITKMYDIFQVNFRITREEKGSALTQQIRPLEGRKAVHQHRLPPASQQPQASPRQSVKKNNVLPEN